MNRAVSRGVKKLQKAFSLKANKGETGIGTLIIFIAMVLVAAVAATVLIHTAGSLQQRAQSTGSQTTQQVSSGIIVQSVWGLDSNASDPEAGYIHWIAIYVTLGTGSSPLNLGNATLSLTYQGVSASLTYLKNAYNSATSGTKNVFNSSYFADLKGANATSHFAILTISDPAKSMTGAYPVISAGDEVALLVNVTAVFGGLTQGQSVSGSVVPVVGSAGVIQFTTPVAFTTTVIQLQ
ncbi:MAG TPA: flagellin [Thermoplasmataceae archaeon]|nr:flagellin [Thermoplasmatales archaeon AK]HLH86040.1 flagellin [Thermoplasmataceae archaeon]